jgi:hypothetical protein
MGSKQEKIVKSFKFGETEYKSSKMVEIPCRIGGKRFFIRTIIISGDVPWLIGKETMEKMGMIIGVKEKTVEIGEMGGMKVKFKEDSRGHMRIGLVRKMEKEEVWVEMGKNKKDQDNKIRKLHMQFGHPGWERLAKLIEESMKKENGFKEGEVEEIRKEVKEVTEKCETCLKFRRTPMRPVVGMTWAKNFNEVVALDLGEMEGKKFMVMVDMATKYCQACWLTSKKTEEVIEKLMEKWIAVFGAPQSWLSDNGGEFLNEIFLIMSEKWNVKTKITAAESPWSNGVCAKWVGLIKDSVRKLTSEGEIGLKISLGWSVAAKNSLYNKQ